MAKIPTYWKGKGKYQKQLKELEGLIPLMGNAEGEKLDELRGALNVYYDIFNNGLDNLAEDVKWTFNLSRDPSEQCSCRGRGEEDCRYCRGSGKKNGESCGYCGGGGRTECPCGGVEFPYLKEWVDAVVEGNGDAKKIEKTMDELILAAAKEQDIGKSKPKSKSKKSSLELKNLTRELKQATEQLKKIAEKKR